MQNFTFSYWKVLPLAVYSVRILKHVCSTELYVVVLDSAASSGAFSKQPQKKIV